MKFFGGLCLPVHEQKIFKEGGVNLLAELLAKYYDLYLKQNAGQLGRVVQ